MLRHLPNLITALRIVLVWPLCALIASRNYAGALLIAAIAGASDALDGFLAKHYGWQSWIGGMLDPIADKLLLTAAFVMLTLAGELPLWFTGLVIGRDVVIVAGAFIYYFCIGRFDAAPSTLSKLTTTLQIIFVLLELLRLSHWVVMPGIVRATALAITALATVMSGVAYVFVWSRRALTERGRKPRIQGTGQ